MKIKPRHIIVPCLLFSAVFAALSISRTLSIFQDAATYEYLIYPYDGRGDVSLHISDPDGSNPATVYELSPGESCSIHYGFTNTSPAKITGLKETLTVGGQNKVNAADISVNSGQTHSGALDGLSYDSLDGLWDESGFCEIVYCCEAASIEKMDGSGASVLVQCEPVRIRAYIRKGS